MIFNPFLSLCILFALLWPAVAAASEYHEQLVLRPLPPSSLLASFNFRSNASLESFEQQNFRYFPRSLGQILQHANTKELHLRFTTGRWDAESWGERPWHGFKEGGTGVELWAWIDADTDEAAYSKWTTLTQSLSGLFCASLNFIDSTRTTRPVVTFEPVGNHSSRPLHFLHGTLPGEVVCTENLTPFLKLLPCKGKAGISSLFDGHRLFDASWQSMAIDVRPTCPEDAEGCQVEIEQTVDMALDVDRSKRARDNPIPRPVPNDQLVCDESKEYNSGDTCYPVGNTVDQGWRLSEVFGRTIPGACPLTEEEENKRKHVCIKVPNEREVLVTAGAIERMDPDGLSRCYSILDDFPFDLVLPAQEEPLEVPLEQPVLHAERTIIGHGQERGGMRSILTNPSNSNSVEFIYFETLPWFMRPYLHTLKAKVANQNGTVIPVPSSEIIKDVFYRPALDRERGTQLELILSVPAASTVTLIYEFEKAILRYTEYPPDANRGFNVGPAVIRLLGDERAGNSPPIYLRTTSLLLPLPTPDFSMPYNVIILTSTVMALAFGSIFNILVRRLVAVEEVPENELKAKILGRIVALRDKLKGKVAKTE
ncbi:Subunit of the glycosylphosphatidylinositol transamidase complex-like protein [Onygenales sp. PD_40]|nr:Subunit of the glycosylphosphatidylinositol transamidase complex-like protein [Onygenales sp. PD_40]KAK2771150.1 Subunit of the glycosylphosphatidylinositol transamidase complex-like protein [Emmonsiellopsis sp. PD_33]KAK2784275.1 Subunit of the glycosylphosphatidylinositol transamidase complex-like protein [Onygenales sp. PD_12]KAK2805677.1 Subunit of the glycosylphosphatidylinositol transamidase complex-like protein [Onygenales sp. PD_10]